VNQPASASGALQLRRRFVFRGNAAAFGGHIIRPKDIVLESSGASSLPVTGGRSVARIARTQFDDLFQIESASTFAEGLFEDRRQFLEFTNHRIEEDALTAATHVNAEVHGLAVGRKPRLTIKRLRAELHAKSPYGSGQPAIRVGNDVAIEGVDIDGHRLIVELDTAPFQRFDTHAKLLVAADDRAFVAESGESLFMRRPRNGEPAPPPTGRLIDASHGTLYATIVKSIRWDGAPFPGSRIDRHQVVLPDFGRVYFGELLVSYDCRRLTMVRMALGSDTGGTVSACDVEDDGGWSWTP
jgi:hypothetical protein